MRSCEGCLRQKFVVAAQSKINEARNGRPENDQNQNIRPAGHHEGGVSAPIGATYLLGPSMDE